ncbi:MAG: OmpA family protein [Myxococcales bacterium]|nr:OmpA family protein [Myxococcales bacterium]
MRRLAYLRQVSAIAAFVGGLGSVVSTAQAQTATPANGFQVNRYEPTSAGEWSLMVDHPWYSSMRYFAAGITLNYAHAPLVVGTRDANGVFTRNGAAIAHQLLGHVDLAGSFLDRVQISATLPITLLERDDPMGIAAMRGVSLVSSVAVGDPRFGLKVRLFGQPYRGAISMSLGADVWVPVNALAGNPFPAQVGESSVRILPKLMLGGLSHGVMWSLNAGFLYRPFGTVAGQAAAPGNTMDSELQIGAMIGYASYEKRFAIGPEALLSTMVGLNQPGTAFKQDYTSLEVLLGIHYNIAKILQLSIGGGVGLLREPGTPDARGLLRLSYAPIREEKPKDRDGDSIPDKRDACPDEPGVVTTDPMTNGCPPPPKDSDGDGIVDPQDQCPTEPQGKHPHPSRRGCPNTDKDGDGVFDNEDKCIDEPAGKDADADLPGCPLRDKDGDGFFDKQDQCVDTPAGANPDPSKPGCPDKDSDNDGVYDAKDQCKDVPSGFNPDPEKPGCPLPDRDNDKVPDKVDACPDKPGAPNTDPKKNGCPGLVEMKDGQIVILKQVFFATNKDVVLKNSFPVLDAVVATLKIMTQVKKVAVEGHTDNKGQADKNRDLSNRRAKSVVKYLVDHGIDAGRLEAMGYGPDRPIADNKTEKGRAKNRRTDFRIVDPPSANPAQAPAPSASPPANTQSEAPAKQPSEVKKTDKADKAGKGKPAQKAPSSQPAKQKNAAAPKAAAAAKAGKAPKKAK